MFPEAKIGQNFVHGVGLKRKGVARHDFVWMFGLWHAT